MVACKSQREYNNDKEKIKQLCLEEKTRAKQKQLFLMQGPSTSSLRLPQGDKEL